MYLSGLKFELSVGIEYNLLHFISNLSLTPKIIGSELLSAINILISFEFFSIVNIESEIGTNGGAPKLVKKSLSIRQPQPTETYRE